MRLLSNPKALKPRNFWVHVHVAIEQSLRLAIVEIPEQVLIKEGLPRALHNPKKKRQGQQGSESCC
jgi:hypothetical protein